MRRSAAVVLSLLLALSLGWLTLEAAVHSVHHLGDEDRGASCPVFSSAPHVPGALLASATPSVEPSPLILAGRAEVRPAISRSVFRPDEGRAPPHPRAA